MAIDETIDMPISLVDEYYSTLKEYSYIARQQSCEVRIRKLKKLKSAILMFESEILQAAFLDMKKPESEVKLSEILPVISEINHAIRNLKKWMSQRKVSSIFTNFGSSSKIISESKGIVLIISPWNFPLNLTLMPLVSAIAAGNTILVKPSELSPYLSQCIKKLLTHCFPLNEVSVVEGGAKISEYLLTKPFDHVFFTGSEKVGSIVAAAASNTLSPVTLELGGKSPVLVDEDTDINYAAKKLVWGKFFNNGQICMAPDYVLVHENNYESLISHIKRYIEKYYGSSAGLKNNPDYGRIINKSHFDRINVLLEDAKNKGAKSFSYGEIDRSDNFIPPIVLTNINEDSLIMTEEIFGPLLPVITYKNKKEAIEFILKKTKPLALYIFSKNKDTDSLLAQIPSGTVCINDVIVQFLHPNLPFGGIGNSGYGSAHGFYGFKTFSHERGVMKQRKINSIQYLYPPYNNQVKKMLNYTIKYFL